VKHGSEGSIHGGRRPPRRRGDAGLRLAAVWNKGATATIQLWEGGTPNEETQSGTLAGVINKFATVQSGRWVAVARGPLNAWYLISAEC
jgi:hypothetical protein